MLEGSGIASSALIAIAGPRDLPLDGPEVEPVFRTTSNADEVHVSSIPGIAAPLDIENQNRKRITEFLDSL